MSVLKDAVVLCQCVLVMLALRYLLHQQNLDECHEEYCASLGKNQDGIDNSRYQEGFLSWVTIEPVQQDKTRCLCCKVSHNRSLTGAFTLFASIHFAISVAVIFLKHQTFSSSRNVYIYTILIIATVLNTLLLTRLVRSDTHHDAVVDYNADKGGLLWRVVSTPFRLIWTTVTSVLAMVFYKIFLGMFGFAGFFGCDRDMAKMPVIFMCSVDEESLLLLNVMKQYAVRTLSWTYIASATANIYSLMQSISKEQCAQPEKGNNNSENDELRQENNCRLCREILAAQRRSRKMIDESDSEDSDQDSFVLGWRL